MKLLLYPPNGDEKDAVWSFIFVINSTESSEGVLFPPPTNVPPDCSLSLLDIVSEPISDSHEIKNKKNK